MTRTTKDIILLGHSEISDKLVPMAYPPFETVGDAERFAEKKIRSVRYCVGSRTTRVRENGEVDIEYAYLTNVVNPRQPIE